MIDTDTQGDTPRWCKMKMAAAVLLIVDVDVDEVDVAAVAVGDKHNILEVLEADCENLIGNKRYY
jgi:hypothetical protein